MSKGTTLNQKATARQAATLLGDIAQMTYSKQGIKNTKSDFNRLRTSGGKSDFARINSLLGLSGKTSDKQRIKIATAKLNSLVDTYKISYGKYGAANLAAQQQINLATKKVLNEATGKTVYARISMYSPEAVKVFYTSTRKLWQAKPGEILDTSTINRRIMKGLGTSSLEEAFNIVTKQPTNQALIKQMEEQAGIEIEPLTEEQKKLLEELTEEDTADYDKAYTQAFVIEFDSSTDDTKL